MTRRALEQPRRWARAAQGALRAGRVAGRVLVALGRLAWGAVRLLCQFVLMLAAFGFGWRFGAR